MNDHDPDTLSQDDVPPAPTSAGDPAPAGAAPQPAAGTATPASPTVSVDDLAAAFKTSLQDVFGGRRDQTAAPARMTLRQQLAAMTPDQRAEFDARVAASGAQGVIELAELMTNERMEAFEAQARPMLETTGDLVIDSFMARRAASDPYYRQVLPFFREQLNDVDRRTILQLPAAARERQLSLRWDAAMGSATRKAGGNVAPPTPEPPPLGGGSQHGGGGARPAADPRPGRVFADPKLDRDEGLSAITAALQRRGDLSADDVKAIESSYSDALY